MNKHFEQIFNPFYYLTTMCCVRKIILKNHKISLINKTDIIVSVLANTGIGILCYFTIVQFISQLVSPSVLYIYVSAYLIYAIDYAILHIVNFVESTNNLSLFLTLREIYIHLSLRKQLNKIRFVLFLPCTIYVCGYLFLIACKLSIDPLWTWTRGLFVSLSLIFDLELIYSRFIIHFLSNKIKTWAKIFRNIDERIDNYESVIRKMDKVYRMLIDAVIFHKKAFQLTVIKCNLSRMSVTKAPFNVSEVYVYMLQILLHFVTCFIQNLFYIEIIILWSKSSEVRNS